MAPQQRKEDVRRVGATTIVLTSDDTPLGHGGLSLRIVRGIESYGDEPLASEFPSPAESVPRIVDDDESEFVGAFGEIDTPMRMARKQQAAARRALDKLSTEVAKPSSKITHLSQAEKGVFDNSFSGCSQDASVAQSLDPLNSFAPTTKRLSSKPTLLLGQDHSESDDEIFADEQMYSESFSRRSASERQSGKLSLNGVNESVDVSPQESTFAHLSQKRSPVLGLGSLALKDTLPRHPSNKGGTRAGAADWTKLMMESRTCEPSVDLEHTSTIGDDSVENSTVSSGSALHRTGNDTFAQLDLGDSDGIRMISTTDALDDDSTGLHNRRALTEKERDSKRQNVMFSGINALKSLGTEMILKAETTIAPPRSYSSRNKAQGGGLASTRSLSFRLSSGKPASSAGNSGVGRPKAPRRAKSSSIFSTREGSGALVVHKDQCLPGE